MRTICLLLILIIVFISGCAAFNGPSDDGEQFTRQTYDKFPPKYGQKNPYNVGSIRTSSMGRFDFTPDLSNISIPSIPGK